MSETSSSVTPWMCDTFCNVNCTAFVQEILSNCKTANSECDCRRFWELPLFWIIFLSIWIVFILVIYCFFQFTKCHCCCKKERKVIIDPVMIIRPMGQPFQVATKQTRSSVVGATHQVLPRKF